MYTCILFGVLILAFFPNLFGALIRLPLVPFGLHHLNSPTSDPRDQGIGSDRAPTMSWLQKSFTLPPKSRGSYLITDHITSNIPEIKDYKVGILHLFIQHTSCALSLNENWDEDVRADMSDALDRIAPEDRKGNLYRHSAEGLDDMPVRRQPAESAL